MFLYNLEEFGKEMRRIRNDLGLLQSDVKRLVAVDEDTLRRLEHGFSVPSLDTLEILSYAYKVDTIKLFNKYRVNTDSIFSDDLASVDKMILSGNFSRISDVKDNVEMKKGNVKVFKAVDFAYTRIFQQSSLIELVEEINTRKDINPRSEIKKINRILRESIPRFNFRDINLYQFNIIEMRLVILLSIFYRRVHDIINSIFILKALLKKILDSSYQLYDKNMLLPKIYFNLAYNSHILDMHYDAVAYAKMGIKHSIDGNDISLLPHLLFRQGVGEYHISDDNFRNTLLKALVFADTLGDEYLKESFIKVLKEKYEIELAGC